MTRFFLLAIWLVTAVSCSEVFEYHPNEIRLEAHQTDLTAKNLQRIAAQTPTDTVRFILMGDTQRFYDHIQDFVSSAKRQKVDFIIHTGDISDFGMAQEFKWVHELMSELPQPYLTVVGNHDLLATGPLIYEQMYGDQNYSFTYGDFNFILLNTNSREYSFDGSIPDINWLQQQLNSTQKQSVVIGHIPPFDSDFDPVLESIFARTLNESQKVNLALFGHKHTNYEGEPYEDGVTYHVSNSMKGRNYSVITLAKDYEAIEIVDF
jgi:3',5'-cyclic AMP phosphodiesterase CpdA